jgi:hypothetical protein
LVFEAGHPWNEDFLFAAPLGKEEILPRVGAREIVEPETCSSSNFKFLTLLGCPKIFFSHGDIALSFPCQGRDPLQSRCQRNC